MVDVLGHVATALLFAAPAWFVWDRRVSVGFVGVALLTSMAPDIDLYLPNVPHHGPTHSILFAVVLAVGGGAVLTPLLRPAFARWWGRTEYTPLTRERLYRFVTVGLLLGALSHLFIDLLSAGTGGNPPLELFWPFFEKWFVIDFIYYDAPRWNFGLFAVAVVLHGVLIAFDSE
ncbi:metal-dependent hydrolase [Halomicrobium salinisoli]|uniref:metal-dependent hydrolase n=1 Tax=Halomicrobium salinisoli TaxID=2878391 RepID=UPI001CF0C3FF|nr:metal-dependent hydrolase [Halomicrobium salinisoli]